MRIQLYSEADQTLWDEFVRRSKNGTFILRRDYMDYHQTRFEDHSLMLWDDKNRLIAVLPANRDGPTLVSHGGLTYGGFVTDESMKVPTMLALFEATLAYMARNSFTHFVYKTIPHIYHRLPAEEDLYALFLCNAQFMRRGVLTVVPNQPRLPFQERRSRGVRRALANDIVSRESDDWGAFWHVLIEVLDAIHGARPVHTPEEIQMLNSLFPENIRLFGSYRDKELMAGVVIYETERVAHAQYIAVNDQGRNLGALDLLFDHLLHQVYSAKPIFDFGTSDENNGLCLKQGLIDQKEGFGARAVMHDHYMIRLKDWSPGQLTRVMQ